MNKTDPNINQLNMTSLLNHSQVIQQSLFKSIIFVILLFLSLIGDVFTKMHILNIILTPISLYLKQKLTILIAYILSKKTSIYVLMQQLETCKFFKNFAFFESQCKESFCSNSLIKQSIANLDQTPEFSRSDSLLLDSAGNSSFHSQQLSQNSSPQQSNINIQMVQNTPQIVKNTPNSISATSSLQGARSPISYVPGHVSKLFSPISLPNQFSTPIRNSPQNENAFPSPHLTLHKAINLIQKTQLNTEKSGNLTSKQISLNSEILSLTSDIQQFLALKKQVNLNEKLNKLELENQFLSQNLQQIELSLLNCDFLDTKSKALVMSQIIASPESSRVLEVSQVAVSQGINFEEFLDESVNLDKIDWEIRRLM